MLAHCYFTLFFLFFLLSFLLHPFLFAIYVPLFFLPSLPPIPRFFLRQAFRPSHSFLFFLLPSLPPSLSSLVFSHRTLAIYLTPPPHPSPFISVATIATPPLRPPPPPSTTSTLLPSSRRRPLLITAKVTEDTDDRCECEKMP